MAQIGLKHIYYATQLTDVAPNGETAGSSTYGTPKKIGNAVSVDIQPATQTANLFGDDMAVATDITLQEISVTIETTDIPLEDQAILLGHTYDSVSGSMTAKGTDTAPDVALLFESSNSQTKCNEVENRNTTAVPVALSCSKANSRRRRKPLTRRATSLIIKFLSSQARLYRVNRIAHGRLSRILPKARTRQVGTRRFNGGIGSW